VQRHLIWAATLWLCPWRVASGQPAGDPTPETQAPVITILSPMDGTAIGEQVRVQARVHHPSGIDAVAAVRLTVAGATTLDRPMTLNTKYPPAPGAAIFEAIVTLAPGATTLVASATDTGGRSTRSETLSVTVNAARGDGNLLVTDNSSLLCSACHGSSSHGSESTGRTYGAWATTCRDCHTPHDTRNASLVAEEIRPPWLTGEVRPAPRPVFFSNRVGYSAAGGAPAPASATFANGDQSGPCQVCHTRTAHWRGSDGPDTAHAGACAFCHRHEEGFKPVACTDCHATPPDTGAHAAHHGASAPEPPFPSDPRPLGCGNCHPTHPARHGDGVQQVELNPGLVLPGGTATAGAVLAGTSMGTTCLVACHFPLGAATPSQPVAWSTRGPLPCTSCHSSINPGGAAPTPRAGPSLHAPGFSEARPSSGEPTTCYSCHDTGQHDATHLTGAPGLMAATGVYAVCIACHSPPSGPAAGPQGQVLHAGADAASSKTPPVLPGWSATTADAWSGDFHGGRRGTCFSGSAGPVPCAPTVTPTGFGGTLVAPYYRGYPAMPCSTCHAGHASQNAFVLAAAVNGVALPAGSIDRAGVGAERLCEACHTGGRHDRCKECHTDTIICPDGQCYMDPSATHVDPAPPGSACFYCHGHEGIRYWTEPYSGQGMSSGNCAHCHGFSLPPPHYAPPVLNSGPARVTGITATSATVAWQTDEASSSWVEYGVGMPGWVAGSAATAYDHSLTLTGLTPSTAYVWRVRSADPMRNVLTTPVASFTTTAAGAVPFPDVVAVGWTGVVQPETSMTLGLTWYPVAAPTGNPVEYRVQLAEDPAFTTLVNGSPPDSGWIAGTPGTLSGREVRIFGVTLTNLPQDWCAGEVPYAQYYWRVKARDSITGLESEWSAVDPFRATSADPWGC
jgi:hypothetical protein